MSGLVNSQPPSLPIAPGEPRLWPVATVMATGIFATTFVQLQALGSLPFMHLLMQDMKLDSDQAATLKVTPGRGTAQGRDRVPGRFLRIPIRAARSVGDQPAHRARRKGRHRGRNRRGQEYLGEPSSQAL